MLNFDPLKRLSTWYPLYFSSLRPHLIKKVKIWQWIWAVHRHFYDNSTKTVILIYFWVRQLETKLEQTKLSVSVLPKHQIWGKSETVWNAPLNTSETAVHIFGYTIHNLARTLFLDNLGRKYVNICTFFCKLFSQIEKALDDWTFLLQCGRYHRPGILNT